MTARDRISRRVRECYALGISGIGVFLASIAIMVLLAVVLPTKWSPDRISNTSHFWEGAVSIGGAASALVLTLIGMIRVKLAARCPWCRTDLYTLSWEINRGTIKFCPYCGKSFDDKLPATSPPMKSPAIKHSWEDELA